MTRKHHNSRPPYALGPRYSICNSGSLPLCQPARCSFHSVGSAETRLWTGLRGNRGSIHDRGRYCSSHITPSPVEGVILQNRDSTACLAWQEPFDETNNRRNNLQPNGYHQCYTNSVLNSSKGSNTEKERRSLDCFIFSCICNDCFWKVKTYRELLQQ